MSEVRTTEEVIEEAKKLPGLHLEICGSWLWITGATYENRKALKAIGCGYSHKKQSWYFHEDEYRKLSNREWQLSEIRDRFGSYSLTDEETITI